jgi:transcription elongation factor/antiterminator RfaH
MSQSRDGQQWFLIHTNPKQEARTISNLSAWNVETFSPQIKEWRYNPVTGERQPGIKPLFSRYVFARFDLQGMFHKVRYTRGVHELVSFGDGPVSVNASIIDLIRSRIGEDGLVKTGTDFKPGDPVVVREGLLKDFTGIFEKEMRDSDRVVVLLNTISYQARLKIDRKMLQKA